MWLVSRGGSKMEIEGGAGGVQSKVRELETRTCAVGRICLVDEGQRELKSGLG